MNHKSNFILLVLILVLGFSILPIPSGAKVQPMATAPAIEGYDTLELAVLKEPYTITWNITDDNPKEYQLTLDGTLISEGSWDLPKINESGIKRYTISEQLLSDPGTYTFGLDVVDYDDLHATITTVVKVNSKPTPKGLLDIDFSSVIIGFTVIAIGIMKRQKLGLHKRDNFI